LFVALFVTICTCQHAQCFPNLLEYFSRLWYGYSDAEYNVCQVETCCKAIGGNIDRLVEIVTPAGVSDARKDQVYNAANDVCAALYHTKRFNKERRRVEKLESVFSKFLKRVAPCASESVLDMMVKGTQEAVEQVCQHFEQYTCSSSVARVASLFNGLAVMGVSNLDVANALRILPEMTGDKYEAQVARYVHDIAFTLNGYGVVEQMVQGFVRCFAGLWYAIVTRKRQAFLALHRDLVSREIVLPAAEEYRNLRALVIGRLGKLRHRALQRINLAYDAVHNRVHLTNEAAIEQLLDQLCESLDNLRKSVNSVDEQQALAEPSCCAWYPKIASAFSLANIPAQR
jgi:hypothetical protein